MENQEEYYEEVEARGEQQPALPPVAINIEIPEGIPENPASPSPVPSSSAGSPGPVVPVGPEDYDSGEESFGGGDLQVFSAAGFNRLQGWAHGVREVRGQRGFIFPVPPIAERFATFLHALYGPRWEELDLSPAGETVFDELRAMLIGFFFSNNVPKSPVPSTYGSVDRPGVPVAAEKISCGWGLLGDRITCQGQVQVVDRSRSAAFLYFLYLSLW